MRARERGGQSIQGGAAAAPDVSAAAALQAQPRRSAGGRLACGQLRVRASAGRCRGTSALSAAAELTRRQTRASIRSPLARPVEAAGDARGGDRTHKPSRAADFKSADFASLSTRASTAIISAARARIGSLAVIDDQAQIPTTPRLREHSFRLEVGNPPLMGIVNVGDDSVADPLHLQETDQAIAFARAQAAAGAQIIDVGFLSGRTDTAP